MSANLFFNRCQVLFMGTIVFLGLLVGCAGTKSVEAEKSEPITISIMHINDHHSHIEQSTIDLQLAGVKTRTKLGGFPQVASVIKEEKLANPNMLVLHAGDAITGTIYYSLFKGKSDAEVMNQVQWDAFVLGNHEFDDGNEVLSEFLSVLDAPAVSANVVPDASSILYDAWKPYVLREVDGQKIGIIGIDIVGKTKNSSNPGPDIAFRDEYETTEEYVKLLTDEGVNKIIVLTHIGHDNALRMASTLDGVDIIVTGDSHTLLGGDSVKDFGLDPEGSYPTMVDSPSGAPVAIVQAWEYAKVVGSLEVSFDGEGVITTAKGTPIFPLSDTFLRKNADGKRVELEGDARQEVYDYIESNDNLHIVVADSGVANIVSKYQEEKDVIAQQKIGFSRDEILGGSSFRIPYMENGVQKSHETAQFVAEASLHTLRSFGSGEIDMLIQNAGGVRTPIAKGDITTETIFTLLPFANTMVSMEMSGSQIRSALEDSIEYALSPDGSTGAFPYTANFRYSVNLNQGKGERTSDWEIFKNGSWTALDMNARYVVGANSYIASGKDGYVTLGEIAEDKKVDTYIEYAQVVIDYIKEVGEIATPDSISMTLQE